MKALEAEAAATAAPPLPPSPGAGTSLRVRPAAATVALARRLMPQLGITRLIDITACDTLGLPVWISLRPQGRSAQLHAGKGVAAVDAEAGALMEAIECAVAERAGQTQPYQFLTLAQLGEGLPAGLSLADFAPRIDAFLPSQRAVPAVRCEDLLSDARPWLPAELVMVPGPADASGPPIFGWSGNGLASGNTPAEATLHALLEVLERDTIALSTARGDALAIAVQTLPDALAQRAAQWAAHGVQLLVRLLPSDFGLPCFEATLYEPGNGRAPLARGWGLHFDRQVALARAVCEAAQVRACSLHAAEPEVAALYGARLRAAQGVAAPALRRFQAELIALPARARFAAAPHWDAGDVDTALAALLLRLRTLGFGHVLRHRMQLESGDAALLGLQVVKVVVPRCESLLGAVRRAGPRLIAAAAARV